MLSLTRKALVYVLPTICFFFCFSRRLCAIALCSSGVRSCVAEQGISQNQKNNELNKTDNDLGVGWVRKVLSVLPFSRQSN